MRWIPPIVVGAALAVIAACMLLAALGCEAPRRPRPCPPPPIRPPHRPHPWR